MLEKSIAVAGAAVALTVVACGSVGGSDPEFWRPAQGFATSITGASGGAGGATLLGSGGNEVPPGGAGGFLSTGGAQAAGGIQGQGGTLGAGGQVVDTGGFFGAGGSIGSTGGSIGSTGGSIGSTGGAMGTGGTNSGTCSFRFDVTTTSYGGRFRPRNVGAIYIENSSGGFVKTLNVWGTLELGMLTDWQQLSGGNKTDAVTGATRSNAGPISGSWDCTDVNHQPVPDGSYQVCCSFQEDDALPFFGPAPKKACVPFTKGAPFTTSAPDQPYFGSMTLTMQ